MSFKVIDAEAIVSSMFSFTLFEDEPLTPTLDDMDYGSQIWLMNMSPMFLYLLINLLGLIVGYIALPILQRYDELEESSREET